MGIHGTLTSLQLQFFQDQGFLVIESFANLDEIKGMRNQIDKLLNGFDCSAISIFFTKNQKTTTDNHFYIVPTRFHSSLKLVLRSKEIFVGNGYITH
ncbi:phytanoyl-CoA dioxygenase [Ranunculus cassubicifolius]